MFCKRYFYLIPLLAAAVLPATPAPGAAMQSGRTLKQSIDIDASIADVWSLFETEEGLRKWMAPLIELDLRVGGSIKSNYHADGVIGDENTIVNTILTYEPQRMLSLKATNPPADFKYADAIKDTWSVMYFEALDEGRTRVRIHGLGYRDTPDSEAMYKFFERGNEWVLQQLKTAAEANSKHDMAERDAELDQILADAAGDAKDPASSTIDLLRRMAKGVWIHEGKAPDGSVFRVRNEIRPGPDRHSFVMTGWQDRGEGMKPHAETLAYRLSRQQGGGVAFICVDEHGAVAQGHITIDEDSSTLIWDWPVLTLDDARQYYRIETRFHGEHQYVMTMHTLNADGSITKTSPPMTFHRSPLEQENP